MFYGFFLSLEAKGSAHSPLFSVFYPIVKGIATSIVLDSLTKEASFPGWLVNALAGKSLVPRVSAFLDYHSDHSA